jgi:hypothetical protein
VWWCGSAPWEPHWHFQLRKNAMPIKCHPR